MSDEGPTRGASHIASVKEYERRLAMSMRLVERATRENVIREIVAGVEEQVRAGGGDFARVAPSLDDPKWVGEQMVKVYGAAPAYRGLFLSGAAAAAVFSVPGVITGESAAASGLALFGFAALVYITYRSGILVSPRFAMLLALTAAAARTALFVVPLSDLSPLDVASSGEVTLFMVATAMLVLVAALPALARRASD